jgi:hypothetical protein
MYGLRRPPTGIHKMCHGNMEVGKRNSTSRLWSKKAYKRARFPFDLDDEPELPIYLFCVSDTTQIRHQTSELEGRTRQTPRWRAKKLETTSRPKFGLFCLPVTVYRKYLMSREHILSKVFSYLWMSFPLTQLQQSSKGDLLCCSRFCYL